MKRLLVLLTAVLATSTGLLAQHSWEEAQLIESSPGAQSFSLLYNRWLKIIVPEEGRVDIFALTRGPWTMHDCVFYRYSSYYDYIFERGTFSCDANAAWFSASDVGPGVYYFYLTGSYPPDTPVDDEIAITYTFTPCPQANDAEPNDDYQHAALLECGTSEGRLGYRTSEDDILDTDDWYKIVVPEEGQIELMAVSYGNMRFYPSQSTVYGYKNNDIYSRGNFTGFSSYGADTIRFKATDVGAGTYYIKIHQYPSTGSGGYTLYYNFTPCPLANDTEPNNDYEHSNLLRSGTTVEGRLGYRTSDDITDTDDWYKIVVPEEGQIELMAVSYGNMRFYPSQSTVYGYKNNDIYSRGNFTGFSSYGADTIRFKATDVGAGTYYIKIHQYPSTGAGGYKLYYKFTPCISGADPEPDDDYQHANRLLNGVTTEGRLGYRASDGTTDTEDWYRITVPKEGHVEFDINGFDDVKLRDCAIYTLNGTTLTKVSNFTGNNSNKVTFEADDFAKNTYYIKVGRYSGIGGYSIRYDGPISDIPGDVDGDGLVTIADATGLIDFLLKGDSSSTLANSDVDGDGNTTIGDVTALIDTLLGN